MKVIGADAGKVTVVDMVPEDGSAALVTVTLLWLVYLVVNLSKMHLSWYKNVIC
jgi:hypothetical protein